MKAAIASATIGAGFLVLFIVWLLAATITKSLDQVLPPYVPPPYNYACSADQGCIAAANGPYSDPTTCQKACGLVYCNFNEKTGYTGSCTTEAFGSPKGRTCSSTVIDECKALQANQTFKCDPDKGPLPCMEGDQKSLCTLTNATKATCKRYGYCSSPGTQSCEWATSTPSLPNATLMPDCKGGRSTSLCPAPSSTTVSYYGCEDNACVEKVISKANAVPEGFQTDATKGCSGCQTGLCYTKVEYNGTNITTSANLQNGLSYCMAKGFGASGCPSGWTPSQPTACTNVKYLSSGWCWKAPDGEAGACSTTCRDVDKCSGTCIYQENVLANACVDMTTKVPVTPTEPLSYTVLDCGNTHCPNKAVADPVHGGWGGCVPAPDGCTCATGSRGWVQGNCPDGQVEIAKGRCLDVCKDCTGSTKGPQSCGQVLQLKCLDLENARRANPSQASYCHTDDATGNSYCACMGSSGGACSPAKPTFQVCGGSDKVQCSSPGCVGCTLTQTKPEGFGCTIPFPLKPGNHGALTLDPCACSYSFNVDTPPNDEDVMVCPDGSDCVFGNDYESDSVLDAKLAKYPNAKSKLFICKNDVGKASPRACVHVSDQKIPSSENVSAEDPKPNWNWCRFYNKLDEGFINNDCCWWLLFDQTGTPPPSCGSNPYEKCPFVST